MDGGIKIKKLTTLLVAIFILVLISNLGVAAEIIVQPGSSIQKAVDSSSSGDIITVKSGTYTENINVTKDDLIIRSESGNPDNTMIKAKSSGASVFLLQGDNIKITGFKAVGATRSGNAGIYLSSCSNCIIENNKLLNNCYGIYVLRSKVDKLSKNTATNNREYGIVLGTATDNTLSGNTALNNGRGIHIGNSDGNTLSGNTIQNSNVYGFYICGKSDANQIYNNYFNDTNMTIKNGIGNVYNTKKTAGTNIVGGPYIGGNFWGKPDGTGFSNTAADNNRDGISDSAYKSITGSIYSDNLPLVVYKSGPTKPIVAFSASPTSGNAPLNVKFTDTSTGSPTKWKWSFGDGTSSTAQNPTHKYSKAGNYTVALTATNSAGSNTLTKTNYIKVVTKPVAAFSASPISGNAPLNVKFTDTSIGTPTKWKWSFGDGTSSTLQNPTHKYSKAGKYTVILTVTNAAGSNTVTKSNYITVTVATSKPVAAYSASPTSGKAALNVQFTDKSSNSPTSWKWSFGDGTSSTLQNPTHKYSAAGKYTVTLTVTNSAGSNTATKSNYITVTGNSQAPTAAFSASSTSGKPPLTVAFADKSTGSPTKWKWSFGDGTSSTVQNPTHKYSAAGKYTVTLTVTNSAGSNTVTKSNYITVTESSQSPVAEFWGSPLSGKAPLKVMFTETSKGSPTAWKWDFGDGKSSTEKNPTHTYSAAGTYTVKLTATNAAGSNTKIKSNYVKVTK
ncbi:PKD domain-containing protein [Methanosarcina sp.]|uniref:PKD domain-containing protein n=1 Tax=Methanosarcina sp. TaxID=2213 RepID=UPI0029887A86|nr:PKD domain-containing protein [Methanosarcina sp.]MDW5550033.1 PKD domain-containing protein [Methanosarcina sp.]MDW5553987.1 PKD domain-containing protein [Methanosarcina sp.]MDW5558508.1 PKD domain-containing protein [Methanosarcina sp.]